MATPNIGRRQELAAGMPSPEILGTIAPGALDPNKGTTSTWTRSDGTVIQLTEPPPPWDVVDTHYAPSDARRFVDVPPQWRLHWINPRLLNSEGWRDWQAVMASDPRVTVRVDTMISPEGYVRRGGTDGDILAWMWQGWYESIKIKTAERVAIQTQSAVDKQSELREEFKRGTFGPHITLEGAKHPTHTLADGKTLKD